jgi:hypothetical protein
MDVRREATYTLTMTESELRRLQDFIKDSALNLMPEGALNTDIIDEIVGIK